MILGKKILITGGAGFIGSHLVDDLVEKGHNVTIFDSLLPQIHKDGKFPHYLPKSVKLIKKDILDRIELGKAIKEAEIVYHLAARVGVAQSMFQIDEFTNVNMTGTARLLDILVNEDHSVKKLIVASSNTVYGEGKYICDDCGPVYPEPRKKLQLDNKEWEIICPNCSKKVTPSPTDEKTPYDSTSIYALGKEIQEKECLMIGKAYGIDTTVLRFFLVYGSRQALSNPYTGVCAIFSASLLNGNQPNLYEDGNQSRDFVHVKDICQALMLSMEKSQAKNKIFNVGTGQQITIKKVAETLADHINPKIRPRISEKYRLGDIRHCFPDISKISENLGYKPKYLFEDGITELIEWVKKQKHVSDNSENANKKLRKMGLI